jgi:hypothetical protein
MNQIEKHGEPMTIILAGGSRRLRSLTEQAGISQAETILRVHGHGLCFSTTLTELTPSPRVAQ